MKKLSLPLLLLTISLSSTAYAGRLSQGDTVKIDTMYHAPIEEERQVLTIAAACQILAEKQRIALDSVKAALEAARSVIKAKDDEMKVVREDRDTCDESLKTEEALTNVQKKKKRKWIGLFFGLAAAWAGTEYVEYRFR